MTLEKMTNDLKSPLLLTVFAQVTSAEKGEKIDESAAFAICI